MSAENPTVENIHKRKIVFNPGELLKSRGNKITAVILALGLIVTVLRFTLCSGRVTNLDDYYLWGIWISFHLLFGVVLAAGGFAYTFA